jgi:hypothetical protein
VIMRIVILFFHFPTLEVFSSIYFCARSEAVAARVCVQWIMQVQGWAGEQ